MQRRDLSRFLSFMQAEEGNDERCLWTSPLSRAFLDALSNTDKNLPTTLLSKAREALALAQDCEDGAQ